MSIEANHSIYLGKVTITFPQGYELDTDMLHAVVDDLRKDAHAYKYDLEDYARRTNQERPIVITPDVYKPHITLRYFVLKRDGYNCRYCGRHESTMCVDHVVPFKRGGKTTPGNLVTCCYRCNFHKSNRTPDECGYVVMPLELTAVYSS